MLFTWFATLSGNISLISNSRWINLYIPNFHSWFYYFMLMKYMFNCINATTVDGGWGTWTSFTTCSHSCSGGLQSRVRKCDSPSPANGGRLCFGDGVETQACNTAACPCQGTNCPGKQFHVFDCASIVKMPCLKGERRGVWVLRRVYSPVFQRGVNFPDCTVRKS